jgi:hypothetical protein
MGRFVSRRYVNREKEIAFDLRPSRLLSFSTPSKLGARQGNVDGDDDDDENRSRSSRGFKKPSELDLQIY